MLIIIKTEDRRPIRLRLPTRMILSKTTVRLIWKYLGDSPRWASWGNAYESHFSRNEPADLYEEKPAADSSGSERLQKIPPEILDEAFLILRQMKKWHPDLPLVDILDADGNGVEIWL